MTPLPLLSVSPPGDSRATSSSHGVDRPERSRNAKAQARHRAKRKAYIEQLEQTVIRLQHALAVSPDQVAPLPPPVGRVRELEEENVHLHREIESLRRQLEAKNARLRPDIAVRGGDTTLDARPYDPEYRPQRHAFGGKGELHTMPSSQLSSPTTLSMPPLMHQYSHSPHSPSLQDRPSPVSSGPSFGYPYHMPETPPSSSTSSPSTPSFSPSEHYALAQQRPGLASGHPAYTQGHYGVVKVEEEGGGGYALSHDVAHPNPYSAAMQVYGATQSALTQWGTYADHRG